MRCDLPIVLLMWSVFTLFQIFFSNDTKKLIAMTWALFSCPVPWSLQDARATACATNEYPQSLFIKRA